MNVFKEIIYSIYNYKYYPNFLKNKGGKVFGVGVLLSTLYFIITMLLPVCFFMLGGGFGGLVEEIPDFKLEDGILEMEESFEFEEAGTLVYIDASPDFVFYDMEELEEELDDYYQVILMDSEKIIVKDDGEMQQMPYDALGFDFERDDLMMLAPYVYIFGLLIMIFVYIWDVAMFFFGVIFVALIGMIIASSMDKKLTFGQLYKLGVYSRTVPLLIKALVSFLPFSIPMFWVFNFGISAVILIFAIKNIPDRPVMPHMQQFAGAAAQNVNQSVYYDPRMTNTGNNK
ncbi:MAG: DUF1189 domain-containing protein [Lachnospiraceae bacterium]|nr:DUF1189 domain-containing protein [Lachnospiraceae bacterium]